MFKFTEECVIKEGERPPGGDVNSILKKYSHSELPSLLFELPRVKNFLLPE
jgi:hypothetical protein